MLLQCWPDNNDVGATRCHVTSRPRLVETPARDLHNDRLRAFGPLGEGNSAPMQILNQSAASRIDVWTGDDVSDRMPSPLRRGLSATTADRNVKERRARQSKRLAKAKRTAHTIAEVRGLRGAWVTSAILR